MITRLLAFGVLSTLVACGDDGGGKTPDAPPAPAMVTVSGTAYEITITGRTPLANVAIEGYKEGGAAPVAMTTTAADGTYSLKLPTDGVALDGYLLGKVAGRKDTYLYPPAPLAADTTAGTVLMLTQQTFDAAFALTSVPAMAGKGWIGVMVVDAANMPVGGATVTSSPAGTVKYNGATGLPNKDATMTQADGIAYIFNVNAGTVTVSAAKAGATFRSHPLNARADQVTTTLVQ